MKPHRHRLRCFDCKAAHRHNYMLRDSLWGKAWPEYEGLRARICARRSLLLCFGCLERRLGRRLRTHDFSAYTLEGRRHMMADAKEWRANPAL